MQHTEIAGFRLSPQQRRLWKLAQEGLASYAQCALIFAGPLELEQLRMAVQRTIARHEALRTTFQRPIGYSVALQVVEPDAVEQWTFHDWRERWHDVGEEAVTALCNTARAVPFDLERGPLTRVDVALLGNEAPIVVLTLPALSADGVALAVLVEDVVTDYYTGAANQPPTSEEMVQYSQYAEWQTALQEDAAANSGRAFWSERLAALPSPIALPLAGHVPAAEETSAVEVNSLGPDLLRTIEDAARRNGVPTDTFMLVCWLLTLWRLTGGDSVTVAVGSDGRTDPDLERLIGPCIRYLPINVRVSPHLSVADLMAVVRQEVDRTATWQDFLPLDQAAAAWSSGNLPASEGWEALSAFTFQCLPDVASVSSGATHIARWQVDSGPAPLQLSCHKKANDLEVALRFDTRRWSRDAVVLLAQHLRQIALTLVGDGEALTADWAGMTVATACRSSAQERTQVRTLAGGPHTTPFRDSTILNLIDDHIAHTPDRVAILCEERQITYAELATRSLALAHRLRRHGVRRGAAVAVWGERSDETIVAMLGILAAGAAFVPLDPDLPMARIRFILEETRAAVLVGSDARGRIAADTFEGITLIAPEVDIFPSGPQRASAIAGGLGGIASAGNAAYIVYTSGSTGTPKGACVEHRSLLNYVLALRDRLDLPSDARYATISTPSVDLGYTTTFGALCSGGSLWIVSAEEALAADVFATASARHAADCLKITPSHLSALLTAACPRDVLPRRRLICGGEPLHWALVERVHELASECHVFNHYGPTETTIGTLMCRADLSMPRYGATVPIGTPLANTCVYLLDAHGELAAAGVRGELHVAGAGVARGYIARPDTTAIRFIPDPYAVSNGGRLYSTGDLGRWLPDGTIEFLGRADTQIKLHGYRIELAEIEVALMRHPDVQGAVVIVREAERGAQLIAYVVTRAQQVSPEELRVHLRTQVAGYMVPARVVVLDHLPLLPSGKADRARLPVMEADGGADGERSVYVEPRTFVEWRLAEIWQDLLQVSSVGIHDNFFALGGDSILGIQVVARANQLGLHCTPKQLFERQTIAELADIVDEAPQALAEQGLITGSVRLTPAQQQALENGAGDEPGRYCDTVVLSADNALDPGILRSALWHVIRHHDALRLSFKRGPEGWEQQIASWDDNSVVPLSVFAGAHDEAAADAWRHASANLRANLRADEAPLLRVGLLTRSADLPSMIVLVWHYLIADAYSMRLALSDLESAYRQLSQGQEPSLPPKTASFRTWADEMYAYAQSMAVRDEVSYWLSQVGNTTQVQPQRQGIDDQSHRVSVTLSRDETHNLLHAVQTAPNITVDHLVLAALGAALPTPAGVRVQVDVERHGREDGGPVSAPIRTVGRFSVRFPLSVQAGMLLDPDRALSDQKALMHSVPGRGLGFGLLRWTCADPQVRDQMSTVPRATIHYNNLGRLDPAAAGSGLLRLLDIGLDAPGEDDVAPYVLRVTTLILNEQLRLHWVCDPDWLSAPDAEDRVRLHAAAINRLAAHCLSSDAAPLMLEDVPEMRLSQDEFDEILNTYGQYRGGAQ